jgi:hypothetical protein
MGTKLLSKLLYLGGLNFLFLINPVTAYAADSALIYSCNFIKKEQAIKPSGKCLVHSSMSQGVYSGTILWEDNTVTIYEGDFNISSIDLMVNNRPAIRSDNPQKKGYCFTLLDDESQLCLYETEQKSYFPFLASCSFYQQEKLFKSNHFCAGIMKVSQGIMIAKILWNDNHVNIVNININEVSANATIDNRRAIHSLIGRESCFTFLDDKSRICIEFLEDFNPFYK